MDGKTTIKYVAFYQLLAAVAAILGFALVGLGVMMGFGESIDIVMNEAPQDWENAVDAAQPVTFAALAVVGVLVWQLGKTVALVVTIGKVSAASDGAGGADVERVESTVMDRVNDRISGVEADVKEHEQKLASASDGSSAGGVSSTASSGNRRSRRRGGAATGDDASTASSSASGSGSASDADGASDAESTSPSDESSTSDSGSASSGGESNRRSNRRASRGGSGDDSETADGDSA
jgi:cobalamin biosynthesis Mg chelatase CobN